MKNKFLLTVLIIVSLFSASVFAVHAKSELNEIKELRSKLDTLQARFDHSQEQNIAQHKRIFGHITKDEKRSPFDSLLEVYGHGPAVVTSPAFGVRRSAEDKFEGDTELMAELSSINEDLVLLRLRQKLDVYAVSHGISVPSTPLIILSGVIEGEINNVRQNGWTDRFDVDISGAELNIVAETGPWITSAMVISYDNGRISGDARVANSKLAINRVFVTLGQLKKLPFYVTVGQLYAPFGRFSSNMITTSLVKSLGRVKERMVILGYSNNGFNAQVYAYPGETKNPGGIGAYKNILGHSGANVSTEFGLGKAKIDLEGSVIGNIAESEKFQSKFFALTTKNESINSRVWGFDGRVKVRYEQFTVAAEYVGAARKFDMMDVDFNGKGARPRAFHTEASVAFSTFNKPCSFAAGYGQSWEALGLDISRNVYFAEVDMVYFKNTIFAVEYRHDVNYNWTDSSTNLSSPITSRHKNTIIAKVFVYF